MKRRKGASERTVEPTPPKIENLVHMNSIIARTALGRGAFCRRAVRSQFVMTRNASLSGIAARNNTIYSSCRIQQQTRGFATTDDKESSKEDGHPAPIPPPLPDSRHGEVVASEKVQKLCDEVLALNIIELTTLTRLFQEKVGLTDDVLFAGMGGGGGGGGMAGGGGGGGAAGGGAVSYKLKLSPFLLLSFFRCVASAASIFLPPLST